MTDDGDAEGPDAEGPDSEGPEAEALDTVSLDPSTDTSTRRNVTVGAVVLVALLIAAVVAVLFWPSDASGYTDEVETNFMAACTADGGDDVEPVCVCLYAEIVETVPYDRFEEVNDSLETEQASDPSSPVRLPADFDEIRQACVDRHGATPATTTSTTATPEADSTTTAPREATTAPAPESPVVTSDAPNAAVPGGVRPTPPPRPPPPPPSPPSPPGPPGSSNDGKVG